MFKRDPLLLFISGMLLLILTVIVIYMENHPQWKQYQEDFKKLAIKDIGEERAKAIDTGILQFYIPSLNRVDRCITCHQGYDVPGFENAVEPFSTHPDLPFMKYHKFSEYGCTICHGGQGYATTTKASHGAVQHWDEPLLDKKLGEKYGLKHPAHIIEINCNICHRNDQHVEWMHYINQAKELVKEKNCSMCHIINGSGGNVGPDLTFEGDKNPEMFDFSNITQGPKTMFNWLYQHFKDPAKVTKGTLMPNFGFTDEQARALTMLMLSWKNVNIPYKYIPITKGSASTQSSEPVQKMQHVRAEKSSKSNQQIISPQTWQKQVKIGKGLFKTKGCISCHTIGKGKLVGPDLKDVTKIRTTKWLTNWLAHTQQMQALDPIAKKLLKEYVVHMPQTSLTNEQIKSIIDYLKSTSKTTND